MFIVHERRRRVDAYIFGRAGMARGAADAFTPILGVPFNLPFGWRAAAPQRPPYSTGY
jgi:hypothetical protein